MTVAVAASGTTLTEIARVGPIVLDQQWLHRRRHQFPTKEHFATPHRGPRAYNRALAGIIDKVGLPRLTSRWLRHTAATHMVQQATDLGELRAIADILGHSPEMLMNTYRPRSPTANWPSSTGLASGIADRLTRAT